ncbi:MAG: SDR family oxidoreductase [Thermomicrobiales bacterium]|nr:SDR family oxidoreductase [Thermomicrobiales bacterium]
MTETDAAGSSSDWSGQTALVTGSTRGLGRIIAQRLAERGVRVIISGRQPSAVDRVVAELSETAGGALGFAADLSDHQQAHDLAARALDAVGEITILVNNAGMSRRGNFWDVTDDAWTEQVNVNLRAPFIIAQHVASAMIAGGRGGRIVNFGTIGARKAHRDGLVYDSAKGAVEVMTRNMAFELAPCGISVNCVVPGAIPDRPGVDLAGRDLTHATSFLPIGRLGKADDIAAAVLFFCAPESAFTTGQSLLVDGAHATYLYEF